MNPEVKQKWVSALRSGDFEQTSETLREDSEDGPPCFCCLGVLCELAALDGVIHSWNGWYDSEQVELPKSVQDWSGLTNNCGDEVEIDGVKESLAEHNDDGRTFQEIADAIEAQL